MIKEVVTEQFKELYKKGLVLADFYSKTCGPCKMLSFVLQDIDTEVGDVVQIMKIDFDENRELIEAFDVHSYPTLLLFKDGKEVDRIAGLQQKTMILNMLKNHRR